MLPLLFEADTRALEFLLDLALLLEAFAFDPLGFFLVGLLLQVVRGQPTLSNAELGYGSAMWIPIVLPSLAMVSLVLRSRSTRRRTCEA